MYKKNKSAGIIYSIVYGLGMVASVIIVGLAVLFAPEGGVGGGAWSSGMSALSSLIAAVLLFVGAVVFVISLIMLIWSAVIAKRGGFDREKFKKKRPATIAYIILNLTIAVIGVYVLISNGLNSSSDTPLFWVYAAGCLALTAALQGLLISDLVKNKKDIKKPEIEEKKTEIEE
ncbi:MAG: hypothetical protein LBQ40_02770 [Clostridiales bacterium]|nr:hypothetical protein [Clostridiales bacterium]